VPGEHAETIALLLLTVTLAFAVVRRRGLPEARRRSGRAGWVALGVVPARAALNELRDLSLRQVAHG
jgi:hypothetical protein